MTSDSAGMTYFKAPETGFYIVSGFVIKYLPTGQYEILENPSHRWYKFWVPETVTKEIYRAVTIADGEKTVYLEANEKIYTCFLRKINV